jgi:hypothetical protein
LLGADWAILHWSYVPVGLVFFQFVKLVPEVEIGFFWGIVSAWFAGNLFPATRLLVFLLSVDMKDVIGFTFDGVDFTPRAICSGVNAFSIESICSAVIFFLFFSSSFCARVFPKAFDAPKLSLDVEPRLGFVWLAILNVEDD